MPLKAADPEQLARISRGFSKRSQPSMALLMIREYLPTMGRPADLIAMVWHR